MPPSFPLPTHPNFSSFWEKVCITRSFLARLLSFRSLILGAFLLLAWGPGLVLGAANHFHFVAPSSPAGSYSVAAGSNSVTFVVHAEDNTNTVDGGFTHVVDVGLYDTINPPLKTGDPNAKIVESNGTTQIGASVPVTFVAGVANFGIVLQSRSDSEQLYLVDTNGSPVPTGEPYPGR